MDDVLEDIIEKNDFVYNSNFNIKYLIKYRVFVWLNLLRDLI